MARLYSIGHESNTITEGKEFPDDASEYSATGLSIATNPVHGTSAGALQCLATGLNTDRGSFKIKVSNVSVQFVRVYINIATLPNIATTFLDFVDSNSNISICYIKLNADGSLGLWYSKSDSTNPQLGSNSTTIPLNTWAMIEMKCDFRGGQGAVIIEAKLNQVVFSTGTVAVMMAGTGDMANGFIKWGWNMTANFETGATSGKYYLDDLAANDNTGNLQYSYPGPGSICYLRPSSAGDNNTFSTQVGGTAGSGNNFTRVSEVTPNDATSYNADAITNDIDDFNIDNTPSTMGLRDVITVVQVNFRYTTLVAALESSLKVRVKKAASGTVSKSAAITPTTTTWLTGSAASPFFPITLYQDPDSVQWSKTTLDSAQIGYEISTGNTNVAAVSAVWMIIESTPPTGNVVNRVTRPYPYRPGIAR